MLKKGIIIVWENLSVASKTIIISPPFLIIYLYHKLMPLKKSNLSSLTLKYLFSFCRLS